MRSITRKNRLGFFAAFAVMFLSFGGTALAGPIGATGDVYVGDGDVGGIFQYDGVTGASVPGNFTGRFALRGARTFMGQAWGPDGNLYAVDNGAIGRWSVDKFDGNTGARISSVVDYNNTSVPSVGKGLAFGPDGDLYVGDWWRARIDRYQAGTFAPKASYLGVSGDNLGTPNYMTFAPNGRLMVVSGGYNQVIQFDTSDGGVSLLGTFATLPGTQQPQDITFGPNGNLFVSGGYMGNVLELDGTTGAYIRDFVPNPGDDSRSAIGLRFDSHGRMLLAVAGTGGYKVSAFDAVTGSPLGDFILEGSGGISSPISLSIKPEPTSIALLAFGALIVARRRR